MSKVIEKELFSMSASVGVGRPPPLSEGQGNGRYCYLRAPCGATSARQFGVALVQEVERVHDFEPLFYSDFDSTNTFGQAFHPKNAKAPAGQRVEATPPTVSVLGIAERKLCALNSPEFTFRMLQLLRQRGVITYAVPTVSPLIELDEGIIDECRREVLLEHSRRLATEEGSDKEDGTGDGGEAGENGIRSTLSFSLPKRFPLRGENDSKEDSSNRRDQAKQFELLQQRLVRRWEEEVQRKWLQLQPLYVVEEHGSSQGLGGGSETDPMRGPEVSLAFFSHIDALTFCILDLFKSASAKGPGGNTGDWSPYLQQRAGDTGSGARGNIEAESSRIAGGGVDATGRSLLETLTWTRLVMYLADCSPQAHNTNASLEGIRIFLAPKSARLLPPAGSNMVSDEGARSGRKITALEKFHAQMGEAYDVNKVRMAKLWQDRGISLLLTAAPKDGSSGESIHFINNTSMRCLRIQQLSHRFGSVMAMELIPNPHNTIACAYVDGVRLYDIETFGIKAFVAEPESVTAMRYIAALGALVVGNKVGDLRLYSNLAAVDRQFLMARSHVDEETRDTLESKHAGRGPPDSSAAVAASLVEVEVVLRQHSEAVCDILPCLLNETVIVSSSLDNSLGFYNTDSKTTRRSTGDAVVLGATMVPSLGLLFCFGVDLWPFVWSHNVVSAKPLSLAGGGSPVGANACLSATGSSANRKHHGARIVAVHALSAPRHSAVSLDRNGGVRVWDLWRMALLQSMDIGSEYVGANVPYFKNRASFSSAFTNYLFDPQRVRFYCFVRQRAFTIKYNKRDDLRTTMLASFEQINNIHVLQGNRLLVSMSKRFVTLWDMVEAKSVLTISVPGIFASLLLQNYAGGARRQIVNDAEGDSDASDASDEDADGEISRNAVGSVRHGHTGLDIVCAQVVEDSRLLFLGLSCGGIVVCSLGNGSVVCFIPPIPYFYGGSGMLSDEGLTAAQEIAAAAKFPGDFGLLYYHAGQDTLFMSGAGHTFYEHRGRRNELLIDGSGTVDATSILYHTYTGMLVIAEGCGTVSLWVQQDQIIHNDSWIRVAHSVGICASSEPYVALVEIPNSPYFVAHDSTGAISLHRIDMHLLFLQEGDDPKGYYMWPGAFSKGGAKVGGGRAGAAGEHPKFEKLRRRFATTAKVSPVMAIQRRVAQKAKTGQVSEEPEGWQTREMSGSILRRYRRQHLGLQRRRSHLQGAAKGPGLPPRSNRWDALAPTLGAGMSPRMDTETHPPVSDGLLLSVSEPPCAIASDSDDDNITGDDLVTQGRVAPRPVGRGYPTAGTLHRKERARRALLKKSGSVPVPSGGQGSIAPVSEAPAVALSSEGVAGRGAVHKTSLPRTDASASSAIPSNSLVGIVLCCRWAHIGVNPAHQALPKRLDSVICKVTAMAYSPQYSFLYVGDETGCVSIYDLTGAVASPKDARRWSELIQRHDDEARREECIVPGDGDTNPLPRFTPVDCARSGGRMDSVIRCVRRAVLHTSGVTSIVVGDGIFGCIHTSSLDGTIQSWSMFLQSNCGAFTLGEQTTRSVFRYPCLAVDSRVGDLVLNALELAPPLSPSDGSSPDGSMGSKTRSSNRLGDGGAPPSSLKSIRRQPPTKGRDISSMLSKELDPILMLPSQLTYAMEEFSAATRMSPESPSKAPVGHSADPGGPCQLSAADSAVRETYSSARLRTVNARTTPHLARAMNAQTRAVLGGLSPGEFSQLDVLLNERSAARDRIGPVRYEKEGDGGLPMGPSGGDALAAPGESPAGEDAEEKRRVEHHIPPLTHVYLTSAGMHSLHAKVYGRCSIYDDVPLPYNSLGPATVPQQAPYAVVSLGGGGFEDDVSSMSPESQSFMSAFSSPRVRLDALVSSSPLPAQPLTSPAAAAPINNVGAVVQYRDWCLGQQHRLDTFASMTSAGRAATGQEPLGGQAIILPPLKAPRGPKSGEVRMAEVVQIFRNMHSTSVGDVEGGLALPGHGGAEREGLPSLFGSRQNRLFGTKSQAHTNGNGVSLGTAPVTVGEIEEGVTLACGAANSRPTRKLKLSSQQSLNLMVEERQNATVMGHPPLISSALIPSQGTKLARVKTLMADDDGESDVGEDSVASEEDEPFSEDEWRAVLDHQRLEREQKGEARVALASLKAQYRRQFLDNQSKVALISTIRDEAVMDEMLRVFSKGNLHTTVAFLLSKEQDVRQTRGKRSTVSALKTNHEGDLSSDVITAYCNSFQQHQSLAELLENAPPVASKIGRNGDMSALRGDISRSIVLPVGRGRLGQARNGGGGNFAPGLAMGPRAQPASSGDVASPHGPASLGREVTGVSAPPPPLGRPISPFVLRKCTRDAFRGIMTDRLLATVTEAKLRTVGAREGEGSEEEGPRGPPPRLKNGLAPSVPLRLGKKKGGGGVQ